MGSHFGLKTGVGNDVASAQYFNNPQQAFSQANQNLQSANYGSPAFLAQQTPATITPGDPNSPDSAPSIQGGTLAPFLSSAPVNITKIQTPSFLQVQNNPQLADKTETKAGKLFQVLSGVIQGGAAGLGQRTVGAGFAAAQDSALQRQAGRQAQQEADLRQQQGQQALQLGNAEIQMLPLKYQAAGLGLQKTAAETNKAQAEADAAPIEAALKLAQAAAAKYKDLGGVAYDISGEKPVPVQDAAGSFIPADEKVAKLANIPVGQPLPVDVYKKLNDISNSGVQSVQANGRSLLVDKQGNTIKDLGSSTPVVVNNLQNGNGFGDANDPTTQNLAQQVAAGKMKIGDVLTMRTPLTQRKSFLIQVLAINPNFNSSDYDIEKGVQKEFTVGSSAKSLTAFNTAIDHAKQLDSAIAALDNGNNVPLNKLGNNLGLMMGKNSVTNFNVIKNALSAEISKVFKGGGATDAEISSVQAPFDSANSPDQLRGAVKQARALMESKREALQAQYSAGKKAQPNFGDNANDSAAPPAGAKVRDYTQVGNK